MGRLGYIGAKVGIHGHWFVPERFRESWRSQGHRLVSEAKVEYNEPRPCLLAKARVAQVNERGNESASEAAKAVASTESEPLDAGSAPNSQKKRRR